MVDVTKCITVRTTTSPSASRPARAREGLVTSKEVNFAMKSNLEEGLSTRGRGRRGACGSPVLLSCQIVKYKSHFK